MNISSTILLILLSYLAYLLIYRLFLHPLAKVPGRKLAASTSWHEFYYDCVKGNGGQHAFKIQEMHKRYGVSKSFFFVTSSGCASILNAGRPSRSHQPSGGPHRRPS